jgi:hypothetical protein
MTGNTRIPQRPGADTQAPVASPGAGAAPALSVVLQSVAACLQAVRAGRSGTAALETVRRAAAAVQALLFQTLRHLGMAQALRSSWHRASLLPPSMRCCARRWH